MSIENDQEPERYYDWMIWKFRKERKKMANNNWTDDAIDRVNRDIAEFHDMEDQMNQLPTPQEDEAWRHKELMQGHSMSANDDFFTDPDGVTWNTESGNPVNKIGMFDVNPDWIDTSESDNESYLERSVEILEECANLIRKKGLDYQGGSVSDPEYYPHGWKSFDTMLTTKVLRFRSVMDQNGNVNYDSASDCLRDLINYSARAIVWLERNKDV